MPLYIAIPYSLTILFISQFLLYIGWEIVQEIRTHAYETWPIKLVASSFFAGGVFLSGFAVRIVILSHL